MDLSVPQITTISLLVVCLLLIWRIGWEAYRRNRSQPYRQLATTSLGASLTVGSQLLTCVAITLQIMPFVFAYVPFLGASWIMIIVSTAAVFHVVLHLVFFVFLRIMGLTKYWLVSTN